MSDRQTDEIHPVRPVNRLAYQLFAAGAVLVLAASVVLAAIGTVQARDAILAMARSHVMGIVSERKARLETFITHHLRAVEALAAPLKVRQLLANPPLAQRDKVSLQTMIERGEWREKDFGVRDLALFDANGSLVARSSGWTSSAALYRPLKTVLNSKSTLYGPVHLSANHEPVLDIAQPLRGAHGTPSGILLLRLATRPTFEKILTDTTGLGLSGEVYLVGQDTVMLTPSRMRNHPQPLTHKMPIPTVLEALKGGQGTEVYRGFLGQDVVGAYLYMPEQHWAMIGEMKVREALSPLRMIVINSLMATGGVLVVLLLAAVTLARTWSRPMVELAEASHRVAEGDTTVRVQERRRGDEIGVLLRSFNRMVSALQHSHEEVRRSQQRLVQSEKMAAVGQLVASIVHEMRNPLSSIKMNLRLLQRRCDEASSEAEHLQLAAGQASRLETMLSELLDYSKPTDFSLAPTDPVALARRAVEAVRPRAEERGVTLDATLPSAPVESFSTDPEQLLRALINLLNNAIEACSEGQRVQISVNTPDEKLVRFDVQDDGRGIHPSVVNRLFDPFFTTKEEGTGLGLANVKKYVDLQGGSLDVESLEGRGSRFSILIPLERMHGETPDRR